MRKEFARPFGELFTGDPDISFPKAINWMKNQFSDLFDNSKGNRNVKIIGVGDIVSNEIVRQEFLSPFIKYLFIDGETQRGNPFHFPQQKNYIKKKFYNPAGFINEEIFKFIRETINDNSRYLIIIDGEEDLLVIPAILETKNSFIFYGQPPVTDLNPPISAGCVVIHNNFKVKRKIREIFDQKEFFSKIK
ncbi:MAG: DUF359 domain-containing protein [Promethearchaeota archaeon]